MKNNKVIIIGIDGGTFDIIKPMVEAGRLPNLSSFMKDGVYGKLISSYPAITVPAWVCCTTGVNPGKLGIYYFNEYSHSRYEEGRLLSSFDLKVAPVWTLLSEKLKRSIVVTVPFTYPPYKINGVMISPSNARVTDKLKTFPPELSAEITNRFNLREIIRSRQEFVKGGVKYRVSPEALAEKVAFFLEKATNLKKDVCLYLMNKEAWDFMMVVFDVDSLQHKAWKYVDEMHPAYDGTKEQKYKNMIYKTYASIDKAIGEIMKAAGDETSVIILSDHGFDSLHKDFYVNNWLIEKGLLTLKNAKEYTYEKRSVPVNIILQQLGLGPLARLLPGRLRQLNIPAVKRMPRPLSELIDWRRSKAYCNSFAIDINLRGRQPDGVVGQGEEYNDLIEYIKRELRELTDPETGEKIIEKVCTANEIYNGSYLSEAHDLNIFFKNPRYRLVKQINSRNLFRKLTDKDRVSGHHFHAKGIFLMKGPHIKSTGEIDSVSILDITPTALYSIGMPLTKYFDGRVLIEAFSEEYTSSHPLQYEEYVSEKFHLKGELSESEEDAIKMQLKNLGYFE